MGQGTLLLAHLREDRLGSSLIAAMSAFSPSMFPFQQMKLPAKLRKKREGEVSRRSEFVSEPAVTHLPKMGRNQGRALCYRRT